MCCALRGVWEAGEVKRQSGHTGMHGHRCNCFPYSLPSSGLYIYFFFPVVLLPGNGGIPEEREAHGIRTKYPIP